MNKLLFWITIAFLLLWIVALSLSVTPYPEILQTYGFLAAEISALILMMVNGTFMDTWYYKLFRIAVVIFIGGMIMKIMHHPGADEIYTVSLLSASLLYILHFLFKKNKKLLDFLKVATATTYFLNVGLSLAHAMSQDSTMSFVLSLLPTVLFWITFIIFIIEEYRKKTMQVMDFHQQALALVGVVRGKRVCFTNKHLTHRNALKNSIAYPVDNKNPHSNKHNLPHTYIVLPSPD